MSEERKYYCLCEDNCKFETMTKEQILAAISQALETGKVQNVDGGFITKVKEKNIGGFLSFWCGTQAQYNAISVKDKNCLYIITDEAGDVDLEQAVQEMGRRVEQAQNAADDATAVDISDIVGLAVADQPSGLTGLDVIQRFSYVKSLGMVFYSIELIIKGKLSKDSLIELNINKYKANHSVSYAATTNQAAFSAECYADCFWIRANEAFSQTDTWRTIVINGWYFCEGE